MPANIREARLADAAAVARLHVETFNETHAALVRNGPTFEVRHRQWREVLQSDDERCFTYVVEVDDGQLIGLAKGQPYSHEDQPDFSGELNKIYVLREFHRRGLGSRLVGRVARRFLSRGVNSMLLFGDAVSASNRFYEALGAERLFATSGDFHGAYGWRDLQTLVERCGGE